jgi:copper(I)-binding protein
MSRPLVLAIAAVALLAAACGTSAAPTPTQGGFISVYGAWARPADAGAESAAYLTITNGQLQDDTLVGASSPIAASAAVHQTTSDDSGMTGMHPVPSVVIRAGQTLVMEPGGYHVMLTGLQQPLTVGNTFQLTLTFEKTGPVSVAVEVRASDAAPS